MLLSVTWLEELLGGDKLDPAAVAGMLTSLGLEVEGETTHGAGLERIVVGEVESKKPHPKADRLTLVALKDGKQTLSVVCGAPNVPEPGGKVAFAPVGTVLPNGLELVEREIRGEKSQGMICAEDELEIGTDHSGVILLPDDWETGARLIDLVPGLVDTVIDVGVTPNRPDALGHVGVARDLAVKLGRPWPRPEWEQPDVKVDEDLVRIEAGDRCGRYFGYTLEGGSVGESPLWLKVRLNRVGLRAINNAVDITNLVLMEYGQPLHAFDRAKLDEGRVVVRRSTGEKMTTLDGTEIELGDEDLVIADANKPQALAGVMGGEHSMVEEGATDFLLEAAWFWPEHIRSTARRHGFHTDSSHRFERGVDHGWGLEAASLRALSLLVELTGARVTSRCLAEGERPETPTIPLRPPRVGEVLGMPIDAADSERILRGLEIELDTASTPWSCRPPTHRPDLGLEEDLIEEVMRHHGLESLPAVQTMPSAVNLVAPDPTAAVADQVVDALVECGLHEVVSFAFTEPDKLTAFSSFAGQQDYVELANPMRIQHSVMRTHMMPGLLDAVALNLSRHGRQIRLFEVGRVYGWIDPGDSPRPGAGKQTTEVDADLPTEFTHGALVLVDRGDGSVDGRHAVSALLTVLERLGLPARVEPVDDDSRVEWLHPGVQACVSVGDADQRRVVGVAGEIHPDLRDRWDLPPQTRVYYAQIRLEALPEPRIGQHGDVPRFPATSRDLSLDLATSVPAAHVVEHVLQAARENADTADEGEDVPRLAPGDASKDSVSVLEDYRGTGIADGRRALLLRLHYRAATRSVTDTEVQSLHDAIVERACESLRELDADVRKR